MDKDYGSWHAQKERVNDLESRPRFHEREIWWSALGANIGDEEDGKNAGFERPIIVFRKFNKHIFWALPVTSKVRPGKFYFRYKQMGKEFSVMLSQIRLMDAKRLKRKIGTLPKHEYDALDQAFVSLLKQTTPP